MDDRLDAWLSAWVSDLAVSASLGLFEKDCLPFIVPFQPDDDRCPYYRSQFLHTDASNRPLMFRVKDFR